ncbi:MAG: hypothetical protein J5708_06015 [Bacteroidales bacterium]|nr:hypothetical protein [Bacteroidales bacterium]
MRVKKGNTYYQDRRKERLEPILLEILKVEEVVCGHEICEVRWHILGKDKVYISEFPMATLRKGEFMNFKLMPRELFLECLEILRNAEVYKNAKRQVVYRMEKLTLNEQKG